MSSALRHKIPFLITVRDLLLIGLAVGCVALLVTFTGEPHPAQRDHATVPSAMQSFHPEDHSSNTERPVQPW